MTPEISEENFELFDEIANLCAPHGCNTVINALMANLGAAVNQFGVSHSKAVAHLLHCIRKAEEHAPTCSKDE